MSVGKSDDIVSSFQATHYCSKLDVRLMLKPNDALKNIKTSQQVDLILYDSDLAKDIDNLKHTIVTLSSGYQMHCLGKFVVDFLS